MPEKKINVQLTTYILKMLCDYCCQKVFYDLFDLSSSRMVLSSPDIIISIDS